MIHAMMDERVHKYYMKRNLAKTRLEVDRCNSEDHEPTCWEEVANPFNHPNYNPTSVALPNLHFHFATPIALMHKDVPMPVTAQKIKEKWAHV